MYSIVSTAIVCGIQSLLIQVEADVCEGMPSFEMVGALSSEVREAKERVKAAIRNSGIRLAPKRVTVSLHPADIRKAGTGFDLPIALSVLAAYGEIPQAYLDGILFAGELSLNGEILPTAGILPMALAAREAKKDVVCVPRENAREAQIAEGMKILPADSLDQVVALLGQFHKDKTAHGWEGQAKGYFRKEQQAACDFADIHGQKMLKRACEVAACGRHNLLMLGMPGSGKTMAAQALTSILPPLSEEEALEIAKIYSVSGRFAQREPCFLSRPFQSPHHTITVSGLVGGGVVPKPGEISLAHKGVLFLDELTEFQKGALETLRQPLEEGAIRLVRSSGTYVFPADIMLVAAMNPCNCGYFPDRNRCTCTSAMIRRHLHKISRPLLDRMDLCVEVKRIKALDLARKPEGESSSEIRERIQAAQRIQQARFAGARISYNSQIPASGAKDYCPMEPDAKALLQASFDRLELTVRGYYRILKVARTIADLEGAGRIARRHILESIQYRSIDRNVWGVAI